MTEFNIESLDKHIQTLRQTLDFLATALEGTKRSDPEWLVSDLINLKGKTGMLADDMRRVWKRMGGEEVIKDSKKRLSIEASRTAEGNSDSEAGENPSSTSSTRANGPKRRKTSIPPNPQDPPPRNPNQQLSPSNPSLSARTEATPDPNADDDYKISYVDISAEVNRRLAATRLRFLQETTPTAQKRPLSVVSYNSPGLPQSDDDGNGTSSSTGTPTKPLAQQSLDDPSQSHTPSPPRKRIKTSTTTSIPNPTSTTTTPTPTIPQPSPQTHPRLNPAPQDPASSLRALKERDAQARLMDANTLDEGQRARREWEDGGGGKKRRV